VGAADSVTGEVQLIPTSPITLGPASGPLDSRTCRIHLSIRVNKLPANPAGGVTGKTDPLTHVALHGVTSGLNGSAGSSAQVTVNRGTPSIQTVSVPVGPFLPAGIRARDSAAVFGLDGAIAPTGSVTFFLCQPNQVTEGQGCGTGGTQVGSAKTLNGITESDETSNTTALGKYCWRVEYSGDTNYLPASHTDAGGECFVVQHLQVEMATQPNPDSGTVLQTSLNDVAILQGTNPSGTITFRLFAPDDPTCFNPIFTEVVPVHGNGSYSTSSGFPATSVTQAGTYQWTAEYSGDCCNDSAASTCGQQPVIIRAAAGPPVPTLSEWGMLAFVTVLLALGSFMLRRRRA
jgi:hypothetical protein